MITTVIFDLDGTLLDTLQDLVDSVNFSLYAHNFPKRSLSEIRMFLGNGYKYLISHAVPENTSECEIAEALDTFKSYYQKHCLDTTEPYAGIREMLQNLKEKGIKMAIVSNKGNDAVKELAHRFFENLIPIAIGESAKVRRKPNPDTVWAAMQQLGSGKNESVYVGDSEVDFETAKNAGIPCISCSWGFRDETFLQEIGVTTIIHHPAELLTSLLP